VSEKKGWASTVLGWFIVQDETAAREGRGTGEMPPSSQLEMGPETAATIFRTEPPAAPGGQVDFDAVFEAAGIDAEERQRVAKASELLASLPADTAVAVKKQIVEAALTAFGVSIEKIIEDGVSEIQALEGYIHAGAADTQKLLQESSRRIQQYEDEIKRIRAVMDQRVEEQQGVQAACNAKKLQVQQILEFFGQEAVARVVQASPRLIDPSDQRRSTR
jgi:uncharacterized protein YaaN involved in tellurite resistance